MLEGIALPRGRGRIALPDERPKGLAEPLYIQNRTVDNIHFYMDLFIPRRLSDPDADALGLVNTMLTETLHSRILGEARERGLVYGMSSNYLQTKCATNWWFGSQVTAENAPALFAIIAKELRSVRDGEITQTDISAAQQYMLGRFQRSGQTVGGTASGYTGRYFFEDIVDDYFGTPERIKAVTSDRIVSVANEFFSAKRMGLGFLGTAPKDLREHLRSLLEL
ncbi:insulinase family protein [Patescibacteria group bacterium]|nr:MAG: insulinase family protein [Patescibacteria group bacterium]